MTTPRIGFCCTYVDPEGDADRTRLHNMRQPTIASIARLDDRDRAARLEEVILDNLDTLDRQLALVGAKPPIERMFRVLSGFLIGWSHPALAPAWTPALRATVEQRLARSGEAARRSTVRLSMHPSQHAILATRTESALANALADIEEHARIFEMMGYRGWHPDGAVITVHGGARDPGIAAIAAGLDRLSDQAVALLTIENDEMSFGLDDLLPLSDRVALLVDFHHHWVHSKGEWLQPADARLARVTESWRGVRPLSHVSVSRESLLPDHDPDALPDFPSLQEAGLGAAKLRGHSDRMWNRAVNALMLRHLEWTDIEVEAKAKNLASADLADAARAAGLAA